MREQRVDQEVEMIPLSALQPETVIDLGFAALQVIDVEPVQTFPLLAAEVPVPRITVLPSSAMMLIPERRFAASPTRARAAAPQGRLRLIGCCKTLREWENWCEVYTFPTEPIYSELRVGMRPVLQHHQVLEGGTKVETLYSQKSITRLGLMPYRDQEQEEAY